MAALAAVAVCVLAGGAAGVGPELPRPVLPTMLLASSDLAPGAPLRTEGYRPTLPPEVAVYERSFGPGLKLGGWPLLVAESVVQDFGDLGTSTLVFDQVRHDLNTPAGTRAFVKEIIAGFPRDPRLKIASIGVTPTLSMPVAQDAIRVTVRLRLRAGSQTAPVEVAVDFLRMDRALGIVVLESYPRKHVPGKIAVLAARKVAAHFKAAFTVRNVMRPAITGAASQGQTLGVVPGTWDGAPSAYTYQWQKCDGSGASCVPIPGAVAETYVVGTADVGARITVAVTGANSVTTATAVATPTAVAQ